MLIHQPWLRIGNDIRVEYEQCLREGRDVAGYEGVVNAFVAMDNELTVFDKRKDWMPSDDCADTEGHGPQ